MTIPYHDLTDLLNLPSSSFELIDAGGGDESGSVDAAENKDGHFAQEDTRQSEIKFTHKYNVLVKADAEVGAVNRPKRGKHTGLSSVVYFIDDVTVADKTKHWTLSVNFHRKADVASSAQTVTRSDYGLTP